MGLVGYIYYACQTRESLVFIKSRKTLAESMDPLNPQNLKVSGEGGRNYKETRSPVTTTAPLLMNGGDGGATAEVTVNVVSQEILILLLCNL